MKFTFSVTKAEINKSFDHVVEHAVQDAEIKGFRKGQAPKDMVIKAVGESKLQQQAIEALLPERYAETVKEKLLKPITYPKINLKTVEKDGSFVFEAEVAEMPEIKLGNYVETIKASSAKSKIWTPDKGQADAPEKKDPKAEEEAKLNLIFDTLLATCEIEVPQMIIEEEVNRMKSRLLDQVNRLGLDIDEYYRTTGKSKESIHEEYEKTAKDSLKLDFILLEIAKDQKITVSNEDVEAFINVVGDAKTQDHLRNSPQEQANLKLMLNKRKTIEKLMSLTA